MRFVQDIERFRGTKEKDAKGLTLEAFLDAYDGSKYKTPANTVDMLIFRTEEKEAGTPGTLRLLMIRRGNHPSIGALALPGGFVEMKENLETAAARELEEETGLQGLPLLQLGTWGDWDRDPRWRVITTAYMTLVGEDLPVQAGDDAADAFWVTPELTEEGSGEQLRILSESGEVLGGAGIRCEERRAGLLTERRYSLVRNDGIAADHALIIAEGIRRLRVLCADPGYGRPER